MPATHTLGNAVISRFVKAGADAATTGYLGCLIGGVPNANGTLPGGVTEVTGGAYVRKTLGGAVLGTPASGTVNNPADIDFPTATADWGTISSYTIHDALTGGNILSWVAGSKQILNTEQLKVPATLLTITVT